MLHWELELILFEDVVRNRGPQVALVHCGDKRFKKAVFKSEQGNHARKVLNSRT